MASRPAVGLLGAVRGFGEVMGAACLVNLILVAAAERRVTAYPILVAAAERRVTAHLILVAAAERRVTAHPSSRVL